MKTKLITSRETNYKQRNACCKTNVLMMGSTEPKAVDAVRRKLTLLCQSDWCRERKKVKVPTRLWARVCFEKHVPTRNNIDFLTCCPWVYSTSATRHVAAELNLSSVWVVKSSSSGTSSRSYVLTPTTTGAGMKSENTWLCCFKQ